jgi:hypothetical protein
MQPLRAPPCLHDIVVQVDRPAENEHDVADHVLVLVGQGPVARKPISSRTTPTDR